MHEVFFSIFPTWQEAPQSYMLLLILLVGGVAGFSSKRFYQALIFHPYEVFRGRRIHTLLTSALIHRNWKHLLINMVAVFVLSYDFSRLIIQEYKVINYLWILIPFILSSIVLMNLLMGYLNKSNFLYTSIGVSGLSYSLLGVCISYFPTETMGDIYLLKHILKMEYAYQYWIALLILFIILSFWRNSRINSKLHLFAYIYGSICAIVLHPYLFEELWLLLNSN
ncbi:rhomboid family intramembrane serine protease [Olivibacter sitiensis]|uniref:rhomboid family intramembrane serine protease n=1 Tax=Olivibacter sitiensis TaxID=376470 RepID=UPI0004087D44|nr:rhomboid family intramembrane serine protease [Olivibacter sitiensis]